MIEGFLAVGDIVSATSVLCHSTRAFIRNKNVDARPRAGMMDMVVRAWFHRNDLEQATALLKDMAELRESKQLPEGPAYVTFKLLQHAWSTSENSEKSTMMDFLDRNIASFPVSSNA